jgi:membrane protein DedA with SNARE-associated domain
VTFEWFIAWLQAANQWVRDLLSLIILWVQYLGPVGVFGGVMIETFIAPIPSPVIPMGAGFLLTQGLPLQLQMLVIVVDVMIVGAVAATIGAFFGYGIAYLGGYPVIARYGKYLGTSIKEVEYLRARLDKSSRDELVLFATRAVPIIPLSVVSLAAGAIRMDAKKFAIFTFLGALPRYLLLGLAGWLVGEAFSAIGLVVDFLENLTLVLLLIFVFGLLLFQIALRQRAKKTGTKPSAQ